MELFRSTTRIDFLRHKHLAYVFSGLLIVASIASLATRGLNLGLDFTGGTLIEVSYEQPVEPMAVRSALAAGGFSDALVQTFGAATDLVIRLAPRSAEESSAALSDAVVASLRQQSDQQIEVRRVEYVGPQMGEELANQGLLAMIYVMIGILLYISFRFQWRFSLGAVAALIHDVIITFGVISFLAIEFDLTVVAALLAVVGYSLNDTIVVFDRIRENFRVIRKATPLEVVNTSINQTLSRTIMTSGTTLIVLVVLFYLGGEIIHAFAQTLIIGIVIGTYSSIYVASALAIELGISKQDLMPVAKEGLPDSMP